MKEPQPQASYALDSSESLSALLSLSAEAKHDPRTHDPLNGAVSGTILRRLLAVLNLRDPETVRHSRRVSAVASGLAEFLGWEGRELKLIEVAALLHDVGKIGIPDNILSKPAELSPDESELVSLHYDIGIAILQACRVDLQVLDFVKFSRVNYNAKTDVPHQSGHDLPLGARILAVAEAYDSLCKPQRGRPGLKSAEALQSLTERSGTQFDGNVVSALGRWLKESNFNLEQAPTQPNDSNSADDLLEANSLCHIFSYLYLLESLYDGLCLLDASGQVIVWNRGAERLLGRGARELLGRSWSAELLGYQNEQGALLPDSDCPRSRTIQEGQLSITSLQMRHQDGKPRGIEVQAVPVFNRQGELQGVAEIYRDTSRSGRQPEYRALRLAASRDPLTSVANRGELETNLANLITEFNDPQKSKAFSLIFLDVDHFKSINDTFGHTAGDAVLIDVARLMQHETYSGELVARYGGEEFVVTCPGTDLEAAIKRAERLRTALAKMQIRELGERRITASFGVAQSEPGDSVESILRRADAALYKAKSGGRNRTCSLTRAAQLTAESQPVKKVEKPTANFVYEGDFQAFVAADMVVYKLGGFVNDLSAKLLKITPSQVSMRLGSTGLMPFWGSDDDSQPVVLEVILGNASADSRTPKSSDGRMLVRVQIRPQGWVRKVDVFQKRAHRVFLQLRSYFGVNAG